MCVRVCVRVCMIHAGPINYSNTHLLVAADTAESAIVNIAHLCLTNNTLWAQPLETTRIDKFRRVFCLHDF